MNSNPWLATKIDIDIPYRVKLLDGNKYTGHNQMLESADAHVAIIFQPEVAALIESVWMGIERSYRGRAI